MGKKFYITTAIPYVNAPPHVGHALEFVQADVLARYHKLIGDEALLLSGSDENAIKNVQAAEEAGVPVEKFVEQNAALFQDIAKNLNVQFDVFQRGGDRKLHFPSSQKLWELCDKNGDIYKKDYKGLYCIGCELFYTKNELNEKGECYEHPGRKLEEVAETNYFFKLSKYQDQIVDLIKSERLYLHPIRKNEMLSFLKEPLHDISISRSNSRARNWGVPVPGDDTQRMYVWFDALNIYQSGVGFGWDDAMYKKWWPSDVHVIGKGITRFHAVYWPAFLLSAGLELPKSIFVHGYVTIEGAKMSKSVGNVIDPEEILKKYGTDALRYYLLREIPTFDDGDYSQHRMQEVYNSDLSNELGNLILRITTIAERDGVTIDQNNNKYDAKIAKFIERYEFNHSLETIWHKIKELNKKTDEFEPWKKNKNDREKFLHEMLNKLNEVGYLLSPFIPNTANKIVEQTQGKIKKSEPLFPRL